jgi:mannitol/fructose-specific phosphotransferase system IIA component (Ntr-type)
VRQREQLMGTGTGHEIAIPHARLPALQRPVLTIGRSRAGIEWDSPDGLPVHLIFLLLTPEREEGIQLQILAALAQAMLEPDARRYLMAADTATALRDALEQALQAQDLVRVRLGERGEQTPPQ